MSARRQPVVTIDGPAGAGKSTTSRALATALGFTYLDTGAIYRAVALALGRARPDLAGALDRAEPVASLDGKIQDEIGRFAGVLPLAFAETGTRVLLEGEDVSAAIRVPEIGGRASRVSALPAVRGALLEVQRALGKAGGVVVEGRDAGTVVFPDAEIKFFLTAAPEVRAARRTAELRQRGLAADEARVLAEILERDERDSSRAVAPLRRPEGAVEVDSSALSAAAVLERMLAVVRARSLA